MGGNIAQGISAMVLTAATMQYLGPPPRRPYVDVLRYPRLGSRIRHLGRIPADRRKSKPAMEGDSPDGDAAGDSKEVKEGAK